jgi:hypothetical protein
MNAFLLIASNSTGALLFGPFASMRSHFPEGSVGSHIFDVLAGKNTISRKM